MENNRTYSIIPPRVLSIFEIAVKPPFTHREYKVATDMIIGIMLALQLVDIFVNCVRLAPGTGCTYTCQEEFTHSFMDRTIEGSE